MILFAGLPALLLMLASVVSLLPFGGGDATRLSLAFLPVMVTHGACARQPRLLPVPLIFATGLVIDSLTHGPLGYWALLLLAAGALAGLEAQVSGQSTGLGRAAVFAIAMAMVGALSWGLASLYRGVVLDPLPMATAALVAILLYPLVALAFMPINWLWEGRRSRLSRAAR